MGTEKKLNWYKNQRKFHFIYKTTCTVNGKFYYGMHSTDNLDDGYVGSGTKLWHSIKKHGRENFKLEILEFCVDREALKVREREVICEEKLTDPMCMNLRLGGEGWESTEASKAASIGNRSEKRTKNPEWLKKISEHSKKLHARGMFNYATRTGQHLDDDHKRRIGEANKVKQCGSRNSQYGTCWIFSVLERKSIKVQTDEVESFLSLGWLRGRKMKFV